MASEFTDVRVQTIRSDSAAVLSNQLMRKAEYDAGVAVVQAAVDAVEAEQATNSHAEATTPATNESLTLAVSVDQEITGEVRLPAESVYQADGSDTFSDSGLDAGDTITLGKLKVSNVVVTADSVTATLDEDYIVDTDAGIITVLANSILIAASVDVTFDHAEVLQGPALEITADGLQAKLGTSREKAARGDHTHTQLHLALTVEALDPSETLDLVVNPGQRITGEVKLATSSGLEVTDGLKVDTAVIATKASVDDVIVDVADHESRVAALEADDPTAVSVADTDSVNLSMDSENLITAVVIVGTGLLVTPSGVVPDYTQVSAVSVTDDHEARIDALEAGSALPCPLPMIVPCCGDTEVFAEAVLVTFRMPGAVTVTEVRASLTGAATTGTVTVDILVNGTSILSTLLTIDATEKTSVGAATPAVIAFPNIEDDDEVTIEVTDFADELATGLKVAIIGTVT